MAKIKGWTKVGQYMWRQDFPVYNNGTLYSYIFIDTANRIRIADGVEKNASDELIMKNSYVYSKNKKQKESEESIKYFMRNYGNTLIHNFENAIKKQKYERCVQEVKKGDKKYNPYAVCKSSVLKQHSKKYKINPYQIGKVKYSIDYYDGKKHNDGSDFW